MVSWMTTAALSIAALSYLPALPGREPTLLIQSAVLLGALCSRRRHLQLHALAGVLASCYALGHFSLRVAQMPPESVERQSLHLRGEVVGPVEQRAGSRPYYRLQVRLDPHQCGLGYCPPRRPLLRLNYYGDIPPDSGLAYHFELRLTRPYGSHSPGAFDYGRWLFSHGYSAAGYIRTYHLVEAQGFSPLHRVQRIYWQTRTRLLEAGEMLLSPYHQSGVMRALLFADRQDISAEQWQAFANSGTSHLMAISGMHIGMVFGGVWLLTRSFARLGKGGRFSVAVGPVAGLLAAAAYAAMAGFSIPSQRALVMVAAFALGFIWRRQLSPWLSYQLALLVVLLVQPLAAHQMGCVLSFAAVGSLLYVFQGRKHQGKRYTWQALTSQGAILLAMLPTLSALGFPQPLASLPVNLLAIPLLGFCLLPLLFAGLLMAVLYVPWAHKLFALADQLLTTMVDGLTWAGTLAGVVWLPQSPVAIGFALLGVALLLLPRGLPGRPLGLLFMSALLLWRAPGVKPGELWVTVIDVGQGLSVLTETPSRALLYDVGPDFDSGYNSADSVIAPLLRRRGIERLDAVVVSHGDRDHAGSLGALLERYSVGVVYAGEPDKTPAEVRPCEGEWQWDGFGFRLIHLGISGVVSSNNASCVLQITGSGQSVLLPGDIEAKGEQRLLERAVTPLGSALLVAPHHGSRSSSSAELVSEVAPRHVVFAAARKHRYGHPHEEVVARYRSAGARCWQTGLHGTMSFAVNETGAALRWHSQRGRYFWQRAYAELCATAD